MTIHISKIGIFLDYIPYFEKMEVDLCELPHVCVCLCILPINFRMPEPIFMKFSTSIYEYIMEFKSISTAYFINPSHKSVCLYVYSSYHC
jgi:hypothetical protein